jgi:hypothetical protein
VRFGVAHLRKDAHVADREQRERESAASDETKFDQEAERDAEERREAAERLEDEPPPTQRDD